MGEEASEEWLGPMMTSREDFHYCERSDRVLMAVLGKTLDQGTIRLALIILAICAVGAALTELG
jgi:hypothetical protein